MIRFLINSIVFLGSAAIGLLVAASVLSGVHIDAVAFVLVVVLFAVLQALLSPFLSNVAQRSAPALVGGVGLITTFIALVITAAVSDGLSIDGAGTWLWATLIVWIVTMLATLLLPVILVKTGVDKRREKQA